MALLPPEYLKSMVSIRSIVGIEDDQVKTMSVATGFLAGYKTGEKNDDGDLYRIFLVTNKHVFEDGEGRAIKEMVLRFNTTNGEGHSVRVNLVKEGKPIWLSHENLEVDLAVLPLNAQALKDNDIDYVFLADEHLVEARNFADENVAAGDGVFVLGFPLGIDGDFKNSAIVRSGIISRVDDELLNKNFFFIDSAAYPGNSGGPVIHKPEVVSVGVTGTNNKCFVIGVVSSGITYKEEATSTQTGEIRIIFTERTGLTKIVPVERLNEIMKCSVEKNVKTAQSEVQAVVEEIEELNN